MGERKVSVTMKNGIGAPVRRKEDARLLIGAGCYSDDVDLPRQAHAFVIRSVHAHARIKSIDTGAAKALDGVLAVLTGADLAGRRPQADSARCLDRARRSRRSAKLPDVVLINKHGPIQPTPYNPLAVDKVRYVGEAVALVVAETLAIAKDAAELVEIDYEVLAGRDRHGGRRRSPTRRSSGTRCRPTSSSKPRSAMPPATENAHSRAPRTSCGSKPGCSASPACRWRRAPRSAIYDKQSGRYFLHAGTGGVVRQKGECAAILGVPPDQGAGGGARHRRQFRHQEFAVPGISLWCCGRRSASAGR